MRNTTQWMPAAKEVEKMNKKPFFNFFPEIEAKSNNFFVMKQIFSQSYLQHYSEEFLKEQWAALCDVVSL